MLLYRYVDCMYHGYGEPYHLETWRVVKETPATFLVELYGVRRRVYKGARSRFACKTVNEALDAYTYRKRRQIAILSAKLEGAKMRLSTAKHAMACPVPLLPAPAP